MITIDPFVLVGAALFAIASAGLAARRDPAVALMCLQLMLGASALTFVAFDHAHDALGGRVATVLVAVAALGQLGSGLALLAAVRARVPADWVDGDWVDGDRVGGDGDESEG